MKGAGPTGLDMDGVTAALANSAFIAGLDPREKSLWRFLVTLFLGIAAYVVVAIVAAIAVFVALIVWDGWPSPLPGLANLQDFLHRFAALAASDGKSFDEAMQILAIGIPDNIFPIFAFIGVALVVHQRPMRAFLTAAARFRWPMALNGLVLSFLIVGPFILVGQMLDPRAGPPPLVSVSGDLGRRALYGIVCFLAFFPAALGEEVLFRGWFLRQLSALTRNPVVLMVVNGVVFAAAHLDFAPDAFLERAIMGAGFTYMALRLGGVEMSTGAHFANNLMIVLFVEPLTLKLSPNNGVDLGELAQFGGLFVGYVLMAELTARWAPLRHWTGADQTAALPASAAAEQFS